MSMKVKLQFGFGLLFVLLVLILFLIDRNRLVGRFGEGVAVAGFRNSMINMALENKELDLANEYSLKGMRELALGIIDRKARTPDEINYLRHLLIRGEALSKTVFSEGDLKRIKEYIESIEK